LKWSYEDFATLAEQLASSELTDLLPR
jgi:hypothetical protein